MIELKDSAPRGAEAPLWAFAVGLYAAPGVADACLSLQDHYGCDVNVLLFAAWIGAVHHRAMTTVEMAETAALVQCWHEEIVGPLRDVRRRLKSGPPPAPSESTEALRTRIKAIELESERIELSLLEQWAPRLAPAPGATGGDGLENLNIAVRHFTGGELPAAAVELTRALARGVAKHRRQEP